MNLMVRMFSDEISLDAIQIEENLEVSKLEQYVQLKTGISRVYQFFYDGNRIVNSLVELKDYICDFENTVDLYFTSKRLRCENTFKFDSNATSIRINGEFIYVSCIDGSIHVLTDTKTLRVLQGTEIPLDIIFCHEILYLMTSLGIFDFHLKKYVYKCNSIVDIGSDEHNVYIYSRSKLIIYQGGQTPVVAGNFANSFRCCDPYSRSFALLGGLIHLSDIQIEHAKDVCCLKVYNNCVYVASLDGEVFIYRNINGHLDTSIIKTKVKNSKFIDINKNDIALAGQYHFSFIKEYRITLEERMDELITGLVFYNGKICVLSQYSINFFEFS